MSYTKTATHVLIGAFAPALLKAAAPAVIQVLRPVLREVIKAGVLLNREIQGAVQAVREDLEDISAEVRSEMDTEDRKKSQEN